MSLKVVIGNFLNNARTLETDNTFDIDFPASAAHDGPGKMAAGFPATSDPGNPAVTFAGNLLPLGADPVNWSVVSGALVSSTDQDHGADTVSLKLTGNGAQANSGYLTVRSGYSYWLEGWGFGSGTGPTAKISLYNPNTKNWWNGTAWQNTAAYLDSSASAAWAGVGSGAGVVVTIEGPELTLGPTTTVQVQIWRIDNSTADPVYFDDIFLYPGVDFAGFFGGHNVPAWVPVLWKTADSSGAQTLRATFTKSRGQFFATLAAPVYAYEHLFIFNIGGVSLASVLNDIVLFFGDLVVGKLLTLSKTPTEPVQIDYNWAGQARLETPGGSRYIANRGPMPPRRMTLNFRFSTAAQVAEAMAVWIDQARGGEVPVFVMPSTEKFPNLGMWGDINANAGLQVSLRGGAQDGAVSGDLAGSNATQEHYADMTVTIDEGATFELL